MHRQIGLLFSPALACALSCLGPAWAARPAPAARINRITVNSPVGKLNGTPGAVTLPDALAQAARNSGDDLIQFDPQVFTTAAARIDLSEPVLFNSRTSGHDRVEGSSAGVTITIDASACQDAGLTIGGQARLTLANLVIRGGRQRVLLAKDAARLTLEHVALTEGTMPGLALFGQAAATLVDCRLTGNHTHGMEIHGQAAATLTQVDLVGNGQSGIACFDEGNITAQDCRIDSNGEWGIVLANHAKASLTRCTLRQAKFANADVSGEAELNCRNCAVQDSERFGIFATGGAAVRLTSSQIRVNGSRGIELQDFARVSMETSQLESNRDYGAILFGQSSLEAKDCAILRNGAHGVSLRGTASGTFTGCAFGGNRYSGIGCLDARDGGALEARQCTFAQNGMRPIYRGPLHIDPLVPTPLHAEAGVVRCLADPAAKIELYLDRAGEAARYVRTLQANSQGLFQVSTDEIPDGWVMTACATAAGNTSEFNVIAGTAPGPVLEALLGRTGPLSDDGGEPNFDAALRRWKPHTHVVFNIENPPSIAVERYVRFLVQRIGDWTGGDITGTVRLGPMLRPTGDTVVIPIRYVSLEAPQLFGRGGVTYMKWDSSGFFVSPMEILLALGKDPQESCPRVLAHEIGHALGLSHARVGLLSRMQGSAAPSQAFVNDFAPTMTYYDVLALQILHDPASRPGLTLRKLVETGILPGAAGIDLVTARTVSGEPTFSPAPPTDRVQAPTKSRP